MVQQVIQADRRASISDICEDTHLKRTTVHTIVKKDLQFSKLAPKFVPRLLTDEQRRFRMRMCELNLQSLCEDDQFLDKIVTGDESWVSIFEVELKNNEGVAAQRNQKPSSKGHQKQISEEGDGHCVL